MEQQKRIFIKELNKEVDNIKNGDYLTEKEFYEKHKIIIC